MIVNPPTTTVLELQVDSIRTDGGTQPRINQDWKIISEYAQDMLEGAVFPPVIVFFDGEHYWLADGFHRYYATKQIGKDTIVSDIRQGSQREAILFSVGVNANHGFRRTNDDKRAVVNKLLRDEEWAKWSDREIARRCGVDNAFVSKLRKEIIPSVDDQQIERLVERNGTTYTMNTTGIGISPLYSASQVEESEEEEYEETEEDRFETAAATGTLDYYYDDLRREALLRDEEERQARRGVPAAFLSSDSNEWYTPEEYIHAAHELMGGIDLDPASCQLANEVVKAADYYDIRRNGLYEEWKGRIWLNPPYGFTGGESNQSVWSNRLIDQFKNGITTEAILLVNANTEAKWFQPLYDKHLICFTDHRIRFYNVNGESSQPTQGNALVYFGSQRKRFIEIFSRFGTVIERAK